MAKDKVQDNLQFVILIGATCVGVVIYLQDTFATIKKVDDLESQLKKIERVVCAIAIDQKVKDVKQICTGVMD